MKYSILKYLLILSVVLSSLTLLMGLGSQPQKSTEEILQSFNAELINADMPNITLQTLDGESHNVRDALTGSVTFVSVWRSGCHYCRLEAPKFAALVKAFKPKDKVRFAYVSWDRDKQEALAFKEEFNMSDDSMIFMDVGGDILRTTALGTEGTPTVFIINKEGKIIARTVGPRSWEDQGIIKNMKALAKNLQS